MSIFTEQAQNVVNRSTFNVSHTHLTSGNMGTLIPIYCDFVNPGDRFTITPYSLVKFQPLVYPIMGNIKVETHFFYVPKRLVWEGWNDFIRGKGGEIPHPYMKLGQAVGYDEKLYPKNGSAAEYLGLPNAALKPYTVIQKIDPSELKVYELIFHEYYRDQNVLADFFEPLVDGDQFPNNLIQDSPSLFGTFQQVYHRAWAHDYFTSCLPFAQQGTAVLMPLTNSEMIDVIVTDKNASIDLLEADGARPSGNLGLSSSNPPNPSSTIGFVETGKGNRLKIDPDGTLGVKLNEEAVTIATLRTSLALQSYLEQLARGGQRINEYIKSMYGVTISDMRAQRPEFIGSSSSLVNVSEILATASTVEAPLAQFAGTANGSNKGETFSYYAEEHGYIMGIMSIMPEAMYMNGLNRKWQRLEQLDYFLPAFENVGEQAVYNKELVFTHDNPDEIFGYIPRNAEYKFTNNLITSDMKRSLAQWHFGRALPSNVALNWDFIGCHPTKAPFAVTSDDEHCLLIQTYFDIKASRPMQRFSNPKTI